MTTIYLDPAAMDATAGAISQHVSEIDATVTDLETACSADVPPSLAGWLAEELRDIAIHAALAALVYAVAALDTALRAEQIQTDQSLAMAVPPAGSPSVAFTETVMGGFSSYGTPTASISDLTGGSLPPASGFFLGATSTTGVSMPGLSSAAFQAQNPFIGAAILGPGAGGFGAGPLDFAGAASNRAIANILAPNGLDVVSPGIYEDERGRQGRLSQTYRDPETGRLEF